MLKTTLPVASKAMFVTELDNISAAVFVKGTGIPIADLTPASRAVPVAAPRPEPITPLTACCAKALPVIAPCGVRVVAAPITPPANPPISGNASMAKSVNVFPGCLAPSITDVGCVGAGVP